MPVLVEVRNLANRPITIHDESLTAQPDRVLILGDLRLHRKVLRAKQAGLSLWILQPTHPGNVTLTATVTGVLGVDTYVARSAPAVLSLLKSCGHKR